MATVPVTESAPVVATTPSPIASLVKWPEGLLQRVRWLMLLAGLAIVATNVVDGVSQSADTGLPWPLMVVALAGLFVLWVAGYVRGRFSLVTDLLSAAALVVLALGAPHPRELAYPFYAAGWMRALHGTPRETTRAMVIYMAALAIAGVLFAAREVPGAAAYLASRAVVGAVIVVAFGLVGLVLATYEASVVRDRRLRRAARALAEARDRQSIYAAALAGARDVLEGARGVVVELAVGSAEDATVVAAAGSGAGAAGGHVRLADLPEAAATALLRGEPVEAVDVEPAFWRALNLEPRRGALYAVPLAGHGTLDGAIVVASDRVLDADVKDDLETLTDVAALAVESQLLLEAKRGNAAPPAAAAGAPPYERVHARLGSAVAAAMPTRDVPSLWPPPADLPSRVRWIFLLLGTVLSFGAGIPALASLLQRPENPGLLVAATAPLWLAAAFVYGYRRSGFPLVGVLVVGVLLTIVLATVEPVVGQFALFSSASVHAVYGDRRRVLLAVGVHLATIPAAVVLAPGQGMATALGSGPILYAFVAAVMAAVIHLISATLGKYERAQVRSRVLRVSGAHLVASTARAHVYEAALDGGRALLTGTAGATVLVATGGGDDLATVAAAGEHGAHAAGQSIHVRDLPESLGSAFRQGTPVDQPRADAAVWRTFDLEGEVGALYAVPLHARGELEGGLVVGSDAPLGADLKDDLQTLASLAALALEDVVLAESM